MRKKNDSPVSKVSWKDDEDVEEEVVKPGTTIGMKFSVLQIIRIPSSMRCGFQPLIHSCECPFAKLTDSWRVLEDFHSQECVQFFASIGRSGVDNNFTLLRFQR